jgi:hypothetical protein
MQAKEVPALLSKLTEKFRLIQVVQHSKAASIFLGYHSMGRWLPLNRPAWIQGTGDFLSIGFFADA